MSARRFAVWNIIGGILWTEAILIAGYAAGQSLHIERYVFPVVGVAVLLSIASLLFELRRNRRAKRTLAAEGTDAEVPAEPGSRP